MFFSITIITITSTTGTLTRINIPTLTKATCRILKVFVAVATFSYYKVGAI